MALGAQRSSVYKLVLNEAGRLIGVGIVLGLISAVGAAMLMRESAVWRAGMGRGDACGSSRSAGDFGDAGQLHSCAASSDANRYV